jgi:hypothetical protein
MPTSTHSPKPTPQIPPFEPNIRSHPSSLSPTLFYHTPFSPSPPGAIAISSLSAPAGTCTSYGDLTPSYLAYRPPSHRAYSEQQAYIDFPARHLPFDGPPQEQWRTPQLPPSDFRQRSSFVPFTRGSTDVDRRGYRDSNTGTYIEESNVNFRWSRGPTEATQETRHHPSSYSNTGLVRRAVFDLPRVLHHPNSNHFRPLVVDSTDEIIRRLPLCAPSLSTPRAIMDGGAAVTRTSPTAGMKRKHSLYGGEMKDDQENDVKPQMDQHGSFTAPSRYADGDRHGHQAREDIIPGVALNLSGGNSYSQHLATTHQKQPSRPNSTNISSSSNLPLNESPRMLPANLNHNSGHPARPPSITPRSDSYTTPGLTNGTINPNAKGLGGESRGISHNGSGDGHHSEVSDQGQPGEKNKRKKPRVALSCAQCTKVSLYMGQRVERWSDASFYRYRESRSVTERFLVSIV